MVETIITATVACWIYRSCSIVRGAVDTVLNKVEGLVKPSPPPPSEPPKG